MSNFDRREAEFQKREKTVAVREKALEEKEADVARLIQDHTKALEYASGMTADEAKASLLQQVESGAKFEAAKMIKRIQDETKEIADREAKEIITRSIQRITRDYVAEATISVVPLPSDGMKGRIIGREGRNIRALEAATGLDVIIDDTPDTVVVSCFEPVRREVGRLALERLIADGRIHPGRIEEIVKKAKSDVDASIV